MLTPFYSKNGVSIYCGECAQVMTDLLADNSVDLVVTSPPY